MVLLGWSVVSMPAVCKNKVCLSSLDASGSVSEIGSLVALSSAGVPENQSKKALVWITLVIVVKHQRK